MEFPFTLAGISQFQNFSMCSSHKNNEGGGRCAPPSGNLDFLHGSEPQVCLYTLYYCEVFSQTSKSHITVQIIYNILKEK